MRAYFKSFFAAVVALVLLALPLSQAEAGKERLTIMFFYTEWCGICRALEPTLDQAIEDLGDAVEFVEYDVDEQPQYVREYRLQYVPTVLAIWDGETVDWFTGDLSYDEIIAFIEGAIEESAPEAAATEADELEA